MSVRRPWLLPFVPLYAAGVAWSNCRFLQHKERAQLGDPVISVGSLSAGGAGKTPVVMALGELLRRHGYRIDVLSRGYGRAASQGAKRVDPTGTAEEFGDEPILMARSLGVPVYVAAQRLEAGLMAERDRRVRRDDRHLSLHLLDDGFQHRQLARAVDIVLFTAQDAADRLLPAGNLREPLQALRRAHVVVLRREEADRLQPVLERLFVGGTRPKTWIIDRLYAVVEGKPSPCPLAFCGIARPDAFRASLQSLGMVPAGFLALRDHQRYDAALMKELVGKAAVAHANGFVTTAKDAVKLTDSMRRALAQVGPLAVCDVSVRLQDEAACVAEILTLIEADWKRRLEP